jgi:hypothetical protein
MTSTSNTSMTLAEFERLLDVYGADRTRWPADARAAAALLAARDEQASRLLAEAEALNRVLQSAPVPALAVEAALAERIVAAAQRSPRMVKLPAALAADGAAPLEAAAAPAGAAGKARRLGGGRMRLWSREAGAVGLLAASLFVGVVIGHSKLSPQLLPALADMAGLADRDALVQIALSDEVMQ